MSNYTPLFHMNLITNPWPNTHCNHIDFILWGKRQTLKYLYADEHIMAVSVLADPELKTVTLGA